MFSHRLATVWACQPIRSAVSLALRGAGSGGVPPGQVRLEPGRQDQPVTAGERRPVPGAGLGGFRSHDGARDLFRQVRHIIEVGQAQP
jgi:hypothetical protein